LFIPLIFLKVIVKKTNANNHETPIYFHSRLLSRFLKGQDYGKVMGGFSAEISFESEGNYRWQKWYVLVVVTKKRLKS